MDNNLQQTIQELTNKVENADDQSFKNGQEIEKIKQLLETMSKNLKELDEYIRNHFH